MKKAKKSLGQNFLTDKNIAKKIINQIPIRNKIILEVGPGYGFLTDFILEEKPKNLIISNVTGSETQEVDTIKDLLIKQIESPVRWRESVIYMIKNGVTNFIEIGPGKVLSGLVKRIDKTINVNTVNKLEDLTNIKI